MEILKYILILAVGTCLGSLLTTVLSYTVKRYCGTIFVLKEDDKIVYSLELDVNPETLQFKKEVRFKVTSSRKSLNRD